MKKRIILVVLSVLLAVTATSSWILENVRQPERKLLVYASGAKSIVKSESYTLQVYRFGENGEEIQVNSIDELGLDAMLPGDGLRFRLKMTNGSPNPGKVRLLMADIGCTGQSGEKSILDYMYLAVVPAEGYTGDGIGADVAPQWIYKKISDLMAGSESTAMIYEDLVIPRTLSDQSVNLDCRLWFDSAAEDLENVTLTIGNFVLNT